MAGLIVHDSMQRRSARINAGVNDGARATIEEEWEFLRNSSDIEWTSEDERDPGCCESQEGTYSDTRVWTIAVSSIILANTVVIALEATYIGDPAKKLVFQRMETCFSFLYIFEILTRLKENGIQEFFCTEHRRVWNWFDFFVTAVGAIGLVYTNAKDGTVVVRIFRVLRLLRLFRALQFLGDIEYVMQMACKATFKLFMLSSLVMFVFAIIFTNLLWDSPNEQVTEKFGDLPSSMWSMFQLMTLDDWNIAMQPVFEERNDLRGLVVVYIFLSAVALMSLVPAIFVEQSLNARDKDERLKIERHQKICRRKDEKMLHELFKIADEDGSGTVSLAELKAVIDDDSKMYRLQKMGLTCAGDVLDIKLGLFDLMEQEMEEHEGGEFEMDADTFVRNVFIRRNDTSPSAAWRAASSIRLQFNKFGEQSRGDLASLHRKVDALVQAQAGNAKLIDALVQAKADGSSNDDYHVLTENRASVMLPSFHSSLKLQNVQNGSSTPISGSTVMAAERDQNRRDSDRERFARGSNSAGSILAKELLSI